MNIAQAESITQLPLSWTRTNDEAPFFKLVDLPFSPTYWIPLAEIPNNISFEQLYHEHLKTLPQGFVLQSCNLTLRDYLIEQGCQVAPMGAEAILDLPWRGKRSVRELARRGLRHGTVREVDWNQSNLLKLSRLISRSPSRQGAQLKHTERPYFDAYTRCFVLETPEQEWFGAVTLSTPDSNYMHTELLLRHRHAPVGIMEALIAGIAQQLTEEGIKYLSLGNVSPLPTEESEAIFTPHHHPNELWRSSKLSFKLGRALNFAYNAEGLWKFKNKFSPRWEPLYICASPHLSWRTIVGLAQAMGYINLVQNQWVNLGSEFLTSLQRPFHPKEVRQIFSKLSYE